MLDKPDASAAKVYRDYTQEQLDAQYNQLSIVGDNSGYKQRKIAESARVRAKLDSILNVAYGPSPHETLDVFKCNRPGAPTLVFLHGGAWKGGHKDEVSFIAEPYVDGGANVVTVNFALVPDVRLDEQVRQAAASIAWTYKNARDFGGDPERVFVTGHSSGGHLTGMMMVTDWTKFGVPANALKGGAPFSGMFDLEPVQLSWRNSYLKMNREEALALSSIRRIPDRPMPLVIGYGSGELDEFRRQSREFAAAWRARGYPCTEMELPGYNHFEVQQQMANPAGVIVPAVRRMMGL
ncbi:MAG TPA: alpha/beta hydrolase [Alphaproteobacteria bacterium]|nr:alpha/beta hydrolase [Alphaproteobacteria bacterium]